MKRHFVNQYGIGIVGGLVGLLCLSVLGFSGDGVHAETTSANASVTVAEACTMTATVNSAHSATINPGQYLQPIGETVLKVICNDAGGYAIYAVGNANNEYGNNKLLANVGGSLNSAYDIATGTATSGSTSNWAMKVSVVSGTYAPTIQNSFGSYHDVPTTYTKVAQLNSMTDATTGSSVSTTYAAYVKSDQPAGSYNGKVKYTMVHPISINPVVPQTTEAGCIRYYPNGSNVEGTMGCQPITSSDTSATLLASNFSREGYGFAGWSTTYDYSDNTGFLGPQEYIEFAAGTYTGSNPGLSLYAHWIKSAGSLQSWSGCSSLQSGAVTALTDRRDNETYAVAKLADGNCWMIENLRLEAEDSNDETLAQEFGKSTTYGNFVGLATAENTNFTNTNPPVANSLYSPSADGDKIVIGINDYPHTRMPRYNNLNTPENAVNRPQNPTSNTFSNDNTVVGMYSYGNYYTWSAAMANTIYYDSPTATDANNKTSETVGTSLCPAGWRLPRGGDKSREATNDFWTLVVTGINNGVKPANYDSSTTPYYIGTPEGVDASKKLRAYPNNFLYSGSFYTSSVYSRGSDGYYWSSTANMVGISHNLYLNSSIVSPATGSSDKHGGNSIRCLVPSA